MTLSGLMNAGLSGLKANGRSLNVTGDNIANVNTVGHRGSRATFQDMLTMSVIGVGQIGGGSQVASVESLFNQGAIVGSARSTDMAISGGGMFTLRGKHEGIDGQFFSRAGMFFPDNEGYLVNPDGLRLQGYSADTRGNILPTLGDLQINGGPLAPVATSQVAMAVRFNANPDEPDIAAGTAVDPTDEATYSSRTTVTVYDSIGGAHKVDVFFTKNTADMWSFTAQVAGEETANGTAGTPVEIASGTIDTTGGSFVSQTINPTAVDFLGAAGAQSIDFDFTGSTAISHPAGEAFDIQSLSQDGSASAEFLDVGIEPDGDIVASYDDGRTRNVGKVALASFRSETNLHRVGGTLFQQTPASGEAAIGYAGAGGRGTLQGAALEQSNVDLSSEFVRLITDQRAYQATSRTITTADELLVETVNLKR